MARPPLDYESGPREGKPNTFSCWGPVAFGVTLVEFLMFAFVRAESPYLGESAGAVGCIFASVVILPGVGLASGLGSFRETGVKRSLGMIGLTVNGLLFLGVILFTVLARFGAFNR